MRYYNNYLLEETCNNNSNNNNSNNNNSFNDGFFYLNSVYGGGLTIPSNGRIPILTNDVIMPNTNEFILNRSPNTITFNRSANYEVTFTIVARIPVNAPTTIPLRMLITASGRTSMDVFASVYNTRNTATLTGTFLISGAPNTNANITAFVNRTINMNNQGIPIQVFSVDILARRLYDVER
jgi:hypothetical protein